MDLKTKVEKYFKSNKVGQSAVSGVLGGIIIVLVGVIGWTTIGIPFLMNATTMANATGNTATILNTLSIFGAVALLVLIINYGFGRA